MIYTIHIWYDMIYDIWFLIYDIRNMIYDTMIYDTMIYDMMSSIRLLLGEVNSNLGAYPGLCSNKFHCSLQQQVGTPRRFWTYQILSHRELVYVHIYIYTPYYISIMLYIYKYMSVYVSLCIDIYTYVYRCMWFVQWRSLVRSIFERCGWGILPECLSLGRGRRHRGNVLLWGNNFLLGGA